MTTRAHSWEVDTLKGVAILGVLAIHSNLFVGGLFHEALINRAVPILLVLFGVSSELWWAKHADASARSYWWSRYKRLLPPVWAAVALWWILAPIFRDAPVPALPWALAHAVGYVPQIGTAWFVTLIVQLVVFFPLLHLSLSYFPPVFVATVTLCLMWWCHLHSFDVVDWMRAVLFDSADVKGIFIFYYLWIFAPARFFPLIGGMILARRELRVAKHVALACGALFVIGVFVQQRWVENPMARNAIAATLDVPLTLVLLALVRAIGEGAFTRALGALGRMSWGIYLGQFVVHDVIFDRWLQAYGGRFTTRLAYFGVLLASGLAFALAERFVRRMRERRQPQLQLAPALVESDPPSQPLEFREALPIESEARREL